MSSPEHSTSPKSPSESDVENLTVMLKEHFKLIEKKAESKQITASARELLDSFNASIDRLPSDKLSKEDKEGTKGAISAFVNKRNRELATSFIKKAKDGEFRELDVLLTTFSRVNLKHMKRMKVTILEPEPVKMILRKKNNNKIFQRHRDLFEKKIKPSKKNLEYFTGFEYPVHPDNVVPMSEIVAKYKMISFFRLADQANSINQERQLCWVLLPELLLFELTAISRPSEIKTNRDSPTPHESSTFLTGRADMVIVSFVGKNDGDFASSTILVDKGFRNTISERYNNRWEVLTYQEVHRISHNLIDTERDDDDQGGTSPADGWEILMLEAKRQGPVGLEATDLADDGEDSGDDDGGDGKKVNDGTRDDGNRSDGEVETGKGEDDEWRPYEEGEDEEDEGVLPEEIEVRGTETTVQKALGLKDYLPQVISQCIAVKTGSPALGPKIIKFVLADGDNWIFGLVNCSGEKNGRKCLTTNVSISPQQQVHLSDRILCVLELLVLWSSMSGKHLQTLFSKR